MKRVKIKGDFKPFTNTTLAYCKKLHHSGYDEVYISLKNLTPIDIKIIELTISDFKYIKLLPVKNIDVVTIEYQPKIKDMYEVARQYALKHNLYIIDLVKSQMPKARFEHTLEVAKLSYEIAIANHLDGKTAFIMGLFHDVTKYLEKKYTVKIMQQYYPQHLCEPYAFYHQYTAIDWIKRHIGHLDSKIIKAIENHTSGNDNSLYSMILFIADKIEPTRGYDTSKEISLAKKNIYKAFKLVKKQQLDYLKSQGVNV